MMKNKELQCVQMGPLTHCMALLYFFITFLLFLNHLFFVPLFPGQNCPGENRSSQPQLLWGCEKFFTWVENNKYTKTRQKNYNLKTQLICSNDHICQCKPLEWHWYVIYHCCSRSSRKQSKTLTPPSPNPKSCMVWFLLTFTENKAVNLPVLGIGTHLVFML